MTSSDNVTFEPLLKTFPFRTGEYQMYLRCFSSPFFKLGWCCMLGRKKFIRRNVKCSGKPGSSPWVGRFYAIFTAIFQENYNYFYFLWRFKRDMKIGSSGMGWKPLLYTRYAYTGSATKYSGNVWHVFLKERLEAQLKK